MNHQEWAHASLWQGYEAAEVYFTDVANMFVRKTAKHLIESGIKEDTDMNGVQLSRMAQPVPYFAEKSTLLSEYSDFCFKVSSWMSEHCEDLLQQRIDAFDMWADNPTSKELAAATLCLCDSPHFVNTMFKDHSDKTLLQLNGRVGLEIAIKLLCMLEE